MSTDTNGSSLLLPQASPPGLPQPVAEPGPSPAPPIAPPVHSPSAEAAAAAVAAIHADALAAQAQAQAQAHAQMQNGVHQQQHHDTTSESPNPLKRSLEPTQEQEDAERLKVARLDGEPFNVSHHNSPAPAPAAIDVNASQPADPAADIQAHQQQPEAHFQSQPQPAEPQQQINPHLASHTATPVPAPDTPSHEAQQHAQQQHQLQPQPDHQTRHLTPEEQQEVMRLIDTDVAARAIEASAASVANAAAPTAPMGPQTTQITVSPTPAQVNEAANALSQSQAQQAMASVPVSTGSAPLDVTVGNVHHAAVVIHDANKTQPNIPYPGPQLQPGPGPISLPNTPVRPIAFPLASPQTGSDKPYSCNRCDMSFRRLHDLKRHGKLHTGEKPHVCPKCERKFARGDALARHSKGVGGCAARRTSMNTFVDANDLDNHNLLAPDGSVVYTQPDARFQVAEGQFQDPRMTSLHLQPSAAAAAAAAATARDPSAAPAYGAVGIPVVPSKDLADGVQPTDAQRAPDEKPVVSGVALVTSTPPATAAAVAPAPALATPAVTTAAPAATTTAEATTTPTTTTTAVVAATPAPAQPAVATTTTAADPSLNMFTSGNAAIWTYIISLESRLATLEKTDREKSEQIAAMEKHIGLIATQLSAPKE
ncbi:uncharacterized protein BROUX77_000532 [Berkeleyomyces rouxiae]|uniref:uncharacterized protein n=1 Tax=Berkeleyomyces rouxiae TaxID=2035830 RepID=UPI003B7EB7BA